jgi:tetratricopeptide (TPR) repeat protein
MMTDHAQNYGAMFEWALREDEQGHLEQARAAYTGTAESGDADFAPQAMMALGVLESEHGDPDVARGWFTKAVESGHPDVAPQAMLNFGVLELHQDRLEEARAWFDRALASGQADAKAWALINLGDLDRRAGRIESTRRRYAEAAATGHPQAGPAALRGLDDVKQFRAYLDQVIGAALGSAADFSRSGRADDLRRAGEAFQRALETIEPVQEIPADRVHLGARLLDVYRKSDDEAFLRAAAACVDRVEPDVALLPEGTRPRYLVLRGDIQLTQWRALYAGYQNAEVRAIGLVDDAIGSLNKALKEILGGKDPVAGRADPLYVDTVALLGSAGLAKRHWLRVTPDLAPYADMLNGILRDQLGDPASRAQCGWILGRIVWEMYAETGQPSLLIDAVARLEKAVDEAPADDANRPGYELKHATVSAWLARETQDARAIETAEGHLRDLWSHRLEVSPAGVFDSAREWADLQARQRNWNASADAYLMAFGASMTLLGRRGSPDDRRIFLRRIRGFGVHAAFALAQAGRLAEAVAMLERGRGIFFAEGPLPGSEDAGHDEAWDPDAAVPAALAGIAAGTTVAFVLSTWYGGAAIALSPGREPWLVDLPQLTDDEVERRLARLMGAYQSARAPANTKVIVVGGEGPEEIRPWAPELDAVARWSWDACMGPLIGSLDGCDELALIPVGTLPLLPLHAAWTDDASRGPGRTYVVDLLAVSYAPHLRAYLAAKDRWTGFADGLALVVDDPDSAGVPPLPGAELETAAIEELFGRVLVKRGPDATAAAIKRELPRASLLHFGCHGIADLVDPDRSSLLLSGEDTLTIAEIGRLDLSGARLCVLSACESAMIGVELPDEIVNLPTAFAQAGAATVVGSLWAVPDEPTALLVGQFYRNLQQEGLTPAQALRQAQRWLRDSTRAEQIAALPPDRRPAEELSPAAQRLMGGIHPTQNITDWAALVVSA